MPRRANADLRAALRSKLGVTNQRISQLAQELKARLPMDTAQAVHVLAHQRRLDVSRYLSPEETAEVRALVAQLGNGSGQTTAAPASRKGPRHRADPRQALVSIESLGLSQLPGMSAAHAKEAERMSAVCAGMYVFENSLRDLIERALKANHGSEWWTKGVHKDHQKMASDRKIDEEKDPWHGKRGSRPIDYVDLVVLAKIIKRNWRLFERIFPDQAWIDSLVNHDMNVSRRPLAHMNPLADDDVANVRNALRKYEKLLKARASEIP